MKPTYVEQAIKEAVEEGGYNPSWNVTKVAEFPELKDRAILDPFFWSSLGKARGWEEFICPDLRCQHQYSLSSDHEGEIRCPQCDRHGANDPSEFFNLRLISHLHEGKDAESFFVEMYKKI